MRPDIEKVAFALAAGGISDPLPAANGGYRILRVVEQQRGPAVPFAEVKDEIVRRLGIARVGQQREAYIAGLRKTAMIDLRVREVPLQVTVPAASLLEPPTAPRPGAAPARPRPELRRGVTTRPGTGPSAWCRRLRPERPPRPGPVALAHPPRPVRPARGRRPGGELLRGRLRGGAASPARPRGDLRAGARGLGLPRGARAVGWALRALPAAWRARALASCGGPGRAHLPAGGAGPRPAAPPAARGRRALHARRR